MGTDSGPRAPAVWHGQPCVSARTSLHGSRNRGTFLGFWFLLPNSQQQVVQKSSLHILRAASGCLGVTQMLCQASTTLVTNAYLPLLRASLCPKRFVCIISLRAHDNILVPPPFFRWGHRGTATCPSHGAAKVRELSANPAGGELAPHVTTERHYMPTESQVCVLDDAQNTPIKPGVAHFLPSTHMVKVTDRSLFTALERHF